MIKLICMTISKPNRKPKKFCLQSCTEEELRRECRKRGMSAENTELAVAFFIRKEKHSDIADRLYIDEKSVTKRKQRMRLFLTS